MKGLKALYADSINLFFFLFFFLYIIKLCINQSIPVTFTDHHFPTIPLCVFQSGRVSVASPLVSPALPGSHRLTLGWKAELLQWYWYLKVIWATKPVKAIETIQLFLSCLFPAPLLSPYSLFYCILSYLLTNMKYSLREFISLVTNTELNNSFCIRWCLLVYDYFLYASYDEFFPRYF